MLSSLAPPSMSLLAWVMHMLGTTQVSHQHRGVVKCRGQRSAHQRKHPRRNLHNEKLRPASYLTLKYVVPLMRQCHAQRCALLSHVMQWSTNASMSSHWTWMCMDLRFIKIYLRSKPKSKGAPWLKPNASNLKIPWKIHSRNLESVCQCCLKLFLTFIHCLSSYW